MVNGNNDTPLQTVLILARPGRKRDILQSLLRSKEGINAINLADNETAALKLIGEHHPKLFLMEVNLFNNDAWLLIKQIKTNWPQVQCLVTVDSSLQQRQALAASADRVLINGFTISELFNCIDELLSKNK